MYRRRRMIPAVATAALLLTTCGASDDSEGLDDQVRDEKEQGAEDGQSLGLQQGPTDQGVEEIADLLAQHDLFHSRINLAEVLDAPSESYLLLFREPGVESGLIAQAPQMGLEMPIKLLVWDDDGQTRVAANDPVALADRYGVSTEDVPELEGLDTELQHSMLAAVGAETGATGDDDENGGSDLGYTMTQVVTTSDDFSTTLATVRSAIEDRGLRILTEVDHTANLADEDVEIDEMRLLLFTDPESSAQLLALRPTLGIDLPQRVLVLEGEEGGEPVTQVAFHHQLFYEERHQLDDVDGAAEPLDDMQADLTAIADAVDGTQAEASDDDAA